MGFKLLHGINRATIILLLTLFFMLSFPALAYTIDEANDTVYINDSNVYLSASPHTIHQSQWVYFTLIPKSYTGNIDALWGFNTSVTQPRKAELYSPHWVNTTYDQSYTFYNVTAMSVSTDPPTIGNVYNTYRRNITYQYPVYTNYTNISGYNTSTIVIAFDSCIKTDTNDSCAPFTPGLNYTVTWHTRNDNYVLWKDISNTFSSTIHDYEGYDKWYFIKNAIVSAGNTYTIRAWIDIPISTTPQIGKYYFAVKPSSETIPDAIAAGHFYALDPWWDSSWTYKINNVLPDDVRPYQISLNISNSTGSNNATHVYCNGKCNVNFTDIRFTLDNTTALPYWIEDNATGKVWVNVTANGTVNMYYGNPSATSTSNGTNTFLFFDDFEQGNTAKWTAGSGATLSIQTDSTEYLHGNRPTSSGQLLKTMGYATGLNSTSYIYEGRARFQEFYVGITFRHSSDDTFYAIVGGYWSDHMGLFRMNAGVRTDLGYQAGFGTSTNVWYPFKLVINNSGNMLFTFNNITKMWTDNVLPAGSVGFSAYMEPGQGENNNIDDIRVRKYASPEPAWATWGSEEQEQEDAIADFTKIDILWWE